MEERVHVYPQHGKPSTKQGGGSPPTLGEVVLLVGDKKNQGPWRMEKRESAVPCSKQERSHRG